MCLRILGNKGLTSRLRCFYHYHLWGFLGLHVVAHSFSIIDTNVWMDCNATTISTLGGMGIVWFAVVLVSVPCSGDGLLAWSWLRLLLVVLERGFELDLCWLCWWLNVTLRSVSFCCVRAYASFLSDSTASMSWVRCPVILPSWIGLSVARLLAW